jgi:hypothetical protein
MIVSPNAHWRFADLLAVLCKLSTQLQNVAKHARASRATVRLSGFDGSLEFSVSDNGAGFAAAGISHGSGLQGMSDRLAAHGGTLAAPGCARVARTARLIAATMLGSAVVALTGLAISVAILVLRGLSRASDSSLGPGHGRPLAIGAVLPIPETAAYQRESMIMRTAYRVIAYLLALSVAVQASLIAFGAFALENNIDKGPVSDGDTTGVTLHHSFAYVVVLFAVALLAVSFGAKVQHGVRWAAIPLGLVVVQFFLAYAAYSAAIVGVLHGLNALAIFAVALLAGRRVPKAAPVVEPSAAEEAPV